MDNSTTNKTACCEGMLNLAAWVLGTLGSVLVIGALAYYSVRRNPTAGVDVQREAVRYQARRDVEAAGVAEINKFAVDGTKENKAQLSVARAMEVLVSEWKDDTSAGRAKLLERLEAAKKAASFE